MSGRRGLTIVELLVCIAIVAVLFGLMLPAVQKIRATAARAQDQNNLRQITLAFHSYASAHSGRLPSRGTPSVVSYDLGNQSPFYNILPYLEPGSPAPYAVRDKTGVHYARVKMFLSPTDVTVRAAFENHIDGPTSYSVNGQVFLERTRLPISIPDGLSNTIAVSQHYFRCSRRFNDHSYLFYDFASVPLDFEYTGTRRGTFADPMWRDVVPTTSGNPPTTSASTSGVTFQVAPRPDEADGRLLQSTQPNGLLVAMFDGSVRTLAPSISERVFWGMITPSGGEVVSDY